MPEFHMLVNKNTVGRKLKKTKTMNTKHFEHLNKCIFNGKLNISQENENKLKKSTQLKINVIAIHFISFFYCISITLDSSEKFTWLEFYHKVWVYYLNHFRQWQLNICLLILVGSDVVLFSFLLNLMSWFFVVVFNVNLFEKKSLYSL